MWELNSTFKPMLLPSLEAHCMQAAEDRNTHTRVIALELLIDSRCHEDDFDEDDLRKQYGDWDWWCLLPLIAERVESMTFGAHAFVIDKGGWTTVKTCSHDQMLEYYS
tara:strand:- start:1922 stop:2245 length:324 start_codon:yes stop_codon:yes gene_type:complete